MGLIGWIKRRALKRALKTFLGGHMDKVKAIIGFIINFGGVLEGYRTQILIFLAVLLKVLRALGVDIPLDDEQLDSALKWLIGLFGAIKVDNIRKALASTSGTK